MADVIAVKSFYVETDYVAVDYTIDELAASSSVTASAVREKPATATLSASLSITAVPTGVLAALINGFANGGLSGDASLIGSPSGALNVSGSLSADAVVLQPLDGDASISALASLTSTANAILVEDAQLPGVVGIVTEVVR